MKRRQAEGNQTTAEARAVRVFIAEANSHFGETIRQVLANHRDCAIVGEAATLQEATLGLATASPDLVLLDLNLLPTGGLKVLRQLARHLPHARIAVLLSDYTPEYRAAARVHGAFYCIGKDHLEEHLAWIIADARADLRGRQGASLTDPREESKWARERKSTGSTG